MWIYLLLAIWLAPPVVWTIEHPVADQWDHTHYPALIVADQWDQTHRPPEPSPEPRPSATVVRTVPAGDTGMGSDVEQWRGLVAAYFPAGDIDLVLAVMRCESGGNPNAYNPSGASGLMQVLASWADNFGYSPGQLFDPAVNLHVSSILWADGISHWNASRHCWG